MKEDEYDELIQRLLSMKVEISEDLSTHDACVWMEAYGKCMMDLVDEIERIKAEKDDG